MSAVNALPFSPLTRRGLSEWQKSISDEFAEFGRLVASVAHDPDLAAGIVADAAAEHSALHVTWCAVLAARQQRSGRLLGDDRGDHMDGHHTDPQRAGW